MERLGRQQVALIAGRIVAFRHLMLPFPPQRELTVRMDVLREIGRATRGEPQDALLVLHPTFSGKTSCARRYAASVNARPDVPAGHRPVVVAKLPAGARSRDLVVALLRGAASTFSHAAKEAVLWDVWDRARAKLGVELVVIDEAQRCSAAGFSRGVTDTFVNMLADGPPLVLMGTLRGEELLTGNDEFNSRLEMPACLDALKWFDERDRRVWTEFCSRLDDAMVAEGIVDARCGLADPPIAEALCHVADGRIGLLKKTIQTALRRALSNDRSRIAHEDLVKSAGIWSAAPGGANAFETT